MIPLAIPPAPPAVILPAQTLTGIAVWGDPAALKALEAGVFEAGWETRWMVVGEDPVNRSVMLLILIKPETPEADVKLLLMEINRGDFGKLTAGIAQVPQ